MTAPLWLLERVAAYVTAETGIRAVARRAPISWREQSDPGRYAVVSQVSPTSPALRGDDRVIREAAQVQVSLWETPAQAAAGTDGDVVGGLIDALEGGPVAPGVIGRNVETLIVPEPDSDDVHHVLTVTYLASR